MEAIDVMEECGSCGRSYAEHMSSASGTQTCHTFVLKLKRTLPDPTPNDMVNHPKHYTDHPAGIECIDVVEHLPFNVGSAIKYLWRGGKKDDLTQDYAKAIWYIQRELTRLSKFTK